MRLVFGSHSPLIMGERMGARRKFHLAILTVNKRKKKLKIRGRQHRVVATIHIIQCARYKLYIKHYTKFSLAWCIRRLWHIRTYRLGQIRYVM